MTRSSLSKDLKRKLFLSSAFFFLFIIFSAIAIINPKWGTELKVSEYRRGIDAVFAIDVSRSMDIEDSNAGGKEQSRLERGLSIAAESVLNVPGARFAAAIGRGKGYLALPLTYDNEACLSFLEALDVSSMTGRSTNLEALVDAAMGAFQSSSPARKVIVLVSDGEAHSGVLMNALNRCVRDGIIVTTIAVGSDEGRSVQSATESAPEISRRNTAVMRLAAERTGGIYIDANREDAASALSAHLFSITRETGPGSSKTQPKERRTLFVILAIIAYGAFKFIPFFPKGLLSLGRRFAAKSFVLAVILFLSSCTEGKLLLLEANYLSSRGRYDEAIIPYLKALDHEDSAPYAEYGLGLTFYLIDEGPAALKRYENSQKKLGTVSGNEHRELRYRIFYNSGIIYFEEGDYHSAADAFKEALRLDPKRIDAKNNLELSLMSITRDTSMESNPQPRSETREILFEYIKQQEQQIWKSREWEPEEEFTGQDY